MLKRRPKIDKGKFTLIKVSWQPLFIYQIFLPPQALSDKGLNLLKPADKIVFLDGISKSRNNRSLRKMFAYLLGITQNLDRL